MTYNKIWKKVNKALQNRPGVNINIWKINMISSQLQYKSHNKLKKKQISTSGNGPATLNIFW